VIQSLFHPMLAAHPKDTGAGLNAALDAAIAGLHYPVLGSTKLDGIRCTVQSGKLYSRSLKLIPNLDLQDKWGFPELDGLDGEITSGPPTAVDVFNKTTSVVMSRDADIAQAVFRVFDFALAPNQFFEARTRHAQRTVRSYSHLDVVSVDQVVLRSVEEVQEYEAQCVAKGYEGVILRDPRGVYKEGRSTVREGGLVAVKRFVDAEAVILDTYEQMSNENPKETNELGRSKRSHAQEGMVGKDTLGGFTVCILRSGIDSGDGRPFNVGTGVGLTALYRANLWANRKRLRGKVIKLKYQAVGTIDAPRLPVFLGFRDRRDR